MSPRIGELNERSLHRALKARYATPGSATEQAVDGFVADVMIGNRLVEIHTGNFWPLKRKLPRLLERYPVTLVYPIAKDRYIVKIPDIADAKTSRRKSPKHGTVYEVFEPLASIPNLLEHRNLTLDIALVVEDAVRVWDERARRRRGGWVTVDRQLVKVVETLHIERMADLFALLDNQLPDRFTTLDLATAMGSSRRLGQRAAFCLRHGGVTEICGKEGNALVYQRVTAWRSLLSACARPRNAQTRAS